jgi:hypothetical protein
MSWGDKLISMMRRMKKKPVAVLVKSDEVRVFSSLSLRFCVALLRSAFVSCKSMFF